MRKLSILSVLLALTACDKPLQTVTLVCPSNQTTRTETIIKAKFYKDYAMVTMDGETLKWNKIADTQWSIFEAYQSYAKPTQQNDADQIKLSVIANTDLEYAKNFSLENNNTGYSCAVFTQYKTQYKKPSRIEKCIQKISNNVLIERDSQGQFKGLQIIAANVHQYPSKTNQTTVKFYKEYHSIPAADAIKLSPNWDYANPKMYNNNMNTREPQEYEKDACETWARVEEYIRINGLQAKKTVFTDEIEAKKQEQQTQQQETQKSSKPATQKTKAKTKNKSKKKK